MFEVARTQGDVLYGEYFEVFDENGYDFNIEVVAFGFTNRESAGTPHPRAREHFSAEETAAAQQLIESYFSNPSVMLDKWKHVLGARFLGSVRFGPDWIIPELS